MIYKPRHFALHELVCPHILKGYDEITALSFFDERLLMTIDFLGDQLGTIYANNYHWDGNKSQRGIRCILCDLVEEACSDGRLYCSAHIRAQALDFVVKGMDYKKVNLWIADHYQLLPFPVRIEKNTDGWTHIDVCNKGTHKVEVFTAKIN